MATQPSVLAWKTMDSCHGQRSLAASACGAAESGTQLSGWAHRQGQHRMNTITADQEHHHCRTPGGGGVYCLTQSRGPSGAPGDKLLEGLGLVTVNRSKAKVSQDSFISTPAVSE